MQFHLQESMRASEYASLAAFARAVLARAVSDDPTVRVLRLDAEVSGGEIEIAGLFLGQGDVEVAAFCV